MDHLTKLDHAYTAVVADALDQLGLRDRAFDPAIRLMREFIARGELGKLGLIHSFNYTNYLYRPRRPEELDTSLGGGILFHKQW